MTIERPRTRPARAQRLTPALVLLLAYGVAAAQSGGEYEITRSAVTSGGLAAGGDYEAVVAIGQPEADPEPAAGGEFVVRGGLYSSPVLEDREALFADGFESAASRANGS